MNRGAITVIVAAVILVSAVLIILGGSLMNNNHVITFEGKNLEQYSGIGSGVLANGTVLDLHGRKEYQSSADIIGKIEEPGIWKVED